MLVCFASAEACDKDVYIECAVDFVWFGSSLWMLALKLGTASVDFQHGTRAVSALRFPDDIFYNFFG